MHIHTRIRKYLTGGLPEPPQPLIGLILPIFYFISIFLCLFWAGLMVTTHADPELGVFVAAEGPKGPFLPKMPHFGPIEVPDNPNGVQTSPIPQHFAGSDVI